MAHGDGSVTSYATSSGIRWRAVIGYTDRDGKYRQRSKGGFVSKTEARKAARQMVQDRDGGTLLDPTTVTFDQFAQQEYLPWIRRKGRTPVTLQNYEKALATWVSPHLGRIQVQQIRMEDVQRMLDGLAAQGLSLGTIKFALVLTQAALQLAVDKDVVLKNVARNGLLVLPHDAPVGRREPWDAEEAKVFLASLTPDKDDMDLAFTVMALTGIRRGEAAGLRWGDLDLDNGLLHVRRSVQSVSGVLHVSEGGKTANSVRIVGLVPQLQELLTRHKMREAERFWANGLTFGDESAVFATWTCTPRSPHTFSTRFQAAVKRAGVRPVPLHSLRHLMVTQAQMNPVVSQNMLGKVVGHANSGVSLRYTHADAEVAHLVADAVAARLFG